MGTVSSLAQDPLQALPFLTRYHALQPHDPLGTLLIGTAYYTGERLRRRYTLAHAGHPSAIHRRSRTSLPRQCFTPAGAVQRSPHAARSLRSFRPRTTRSPRRARAGSSSAQTVPASLGRARKKPSPSIPKITPPTSACCSSTRATADPRRDAQAHHFEAVKDQNEQAYREAMRVIEVHPEAPGRLRKINPLQK